MSAGLRPWRRRGKSAADPPLIRIRVRISIRRCQSRSTVDSGGLERLFLTLTLTLTLTLIARHTLIISIGVRHQLVYFGTPFYGSRQVRQVRLLSCCHVLREGVEGVEGVGSTPSGCTDRVNLTR